MDGKKSNNQTSVPDSPITYLWVMQKPVINWFRNFHTGSTQMLDVKLGGLLLHTGTEV